MSGWVFYPLAILGFLIGLPYYAIKIPLLRLERILRDSLDDTFRYLGTWM